MNAFFTLGALSLIGWAQSSSFTDWNDSNMAMRKNEVALSYINTLDICPLEVPHCPGNAEPKCMQDPGSIHEGPPSRGNTQWRCVMCEDNTVERACFMVIPIESYFRVQESPTATSSNKRSGNKRNTTLAFAQPVQQKRRRHQPQAQQKIQQLGESDQQNVQPLNVQQMKVKTFYQPPNIPHQQRNTPYQQSNTPYQPPSIPHQQLNTPYQQSNTPYQPPNIPYQPPNIPYQQPNILYQQPNIPYQQPNIPYQQPIIPDALTSYRYQQLPHRTYSQPMIGPNNMYAPQTNPYVQSSYQVPPQYSPQLQNY